MAVGIEDLDAFLITDVNQIIRSTLTAISINCNDSPDFPSTKLTTPRPLRSCLADIPGTRRAKVLFDFRRRGFDLSLVHLTTEHQQKVSRRIELLHTLIPSIDYVDISNAIECDTLWSAELTIARAFGSRLTDIIIHRNAYLKFRSTAFDHVPSPGLDELPTAGELDDATAVLINSKDVSVIRRSGDASGNIAGRISGRNALTTRPKGCGHFRRSSEL